MEDKMDKISIIVPIYNVEQFINKCLDSIINQTYKNLEILLIDDETPDNSGKICDEYAKADKRIIVIHKKNGGVCSARNIGIELAAGNYIGWVDPDDWIELDMFEYLITNAKKYDADIVSSRYYRVKGNKKTLTGKFDKFTIFNNHEANENMVDNFFWNKLFKKEIFNNIKFPEGWIYEGTFTMHKLFEKSKKIVLLPEAKYYYVYYEKSYMNTHSVKNKSDYIYAQICRYNDLHKNYPKIQDLLMDRIIKYSIRLVDLCYKRKNEIEKNLDSLKTIGEFFNDNLDYISKLEFNKYKLRSIKYLMTFSKYDLCIGHLLFFAYRTKMFLLDKYKKVVLMLT